MVIIAAAASSLWPARRGEKLEKAAQMAEESEMASIIMAIR